MILTHPSPHFNKRKPGTQIQCIVLHADAGQSDAGTLDWLQSPESKVSYHALVGRNGGVYTLVDYAHRAWHAGVANWKGHTDVNNLSIGLAFANRHDGKEALTPIQIAVMQGVVQYLRQTYPGIEVTTHAAIAPQRKRDPLDCVGFRLEDFQSYP